MSSNSSLFKSLIGFLFFLLYLFVLAPPTLAGCSTAETWYGGSEDVAFCAANPTYDTGCVNFGNAYWSACDASVYTWNRERCEWNSSSGQMEKHFYSYGNCDGNCTGCGTTSEPTPTSTPTSTPTPIPTPAPSGSISGSACTTTTAQGTSTITWSTSNVTSAQVWAEDTIGTGPPENPTLFASGLSGSQNAAWIKPRPADHSYSFRLYNCSGGCNGVSGTSFPTNPILASTTVTCLIPVFRRARVLV